MTRTLSKYSLSHKLADGIHSELWYASYEETKYAIKCIPITDIPKKNIQLLNSFNNQQQVLSRLSHPNILTLYEVSDREVLRKESGEEDIIMYLAFELACRGDLFECISRTGSFSEELARHYFKVLIDALEYIHENGYVHQNLKLENLLLTSDYDLKVGGFGHSSLSTVPMPYTCMSVNNYHAPEINAKTPYSGIKADIFSLGVLLFIMVVGHPPFTRAVPQDKWCHMLYTCNNKFWMNVELRRKKTKFSSSFKDFINTLLSLEPEHRPTITEIKTHPWYTEPELCTEKVKEEMGRRYKEIV